MAAAGAAVALVERGERAFALQQHGFTIVNPDGSLRRVSGIRIAEARDAQTPHDPVVLAMKAQDISAALPL